MKFNANYLVSSKEGLEYLEGRLDLLSRHCSFPRDEKTSLDVFVRQDDLGVVQIFPISSPMLALSYRSRAIDSHPTEQPSDLLVTPSQGGDRVTIREQNDNVTYYQFHNAQASINDVFGRSSA